MNLHPQVQAMVERIADAGIKPSWQGTVSEARGRIASLTSLTGPGPRMVDEQDLVIPVSGADLSARLYRPSPDPSPGITFYLHGGGWTVGEVDHFDGLCRRLAVASGNDVLSVGYRLAPEHPYPAAVHDVDAALRWAAGELTGGRPLILLGDSSGANLAAVAALHARDRGFPSIARQILVCPVLDCSLESESYALYGDTGYSLGTRDMMWYWDHYAPDPARRSEPDASPLRAGSLADLAPALIIVAEQDVLRDDGMRYADRLDAEGVPVELVVFDDVTHGFFALAGLLDRGNDAVRIVGDAIRAAAAGSGIVTNADG